MDVSGRILAAVSYCLRHIRDASGTPQRVGGVSLVATHPEARGQGHASRLLLRAVDLMRGEGCRWSQLSTYISPFYERLGWRVMATRFRQGMLTPETLAPNTAYTIHALGPDELAARLGEIAAVYDAYNAGRPLTTVREPAYWRAYTLPRLLAPAATLLAASHGPDAPLCGYALAHFQEETFAITEIGALPGEATATALIFAVAAEAARRGIDKGRVYIPFEPEIDMALRTIYRVAEQGEHRVFMVRPLASDIDVDQIAAIPRAPGAIPWPADDF
jgi:GNAT superfamily N-acetyltransferase